MKKHATCRNAILFVTLQVTVFTSQIAIANYADLLEECGGHTNYGLAGNDTGGVAPTQAESIPKSISKVLPVKMLEANPNPLVAADDTATNNLSGEGAHESAFAR